MENRKVYLDKHTNLLQLEEHMYPLVDVDTPDVFRNLFHYDEIPKIAFNDRIVPHSMPDEIWITDTTFRGWTAVESTLFNGSDCKPFFRLYAQAWRFAGEDSSE